MALHTDTGLKLLLEQILLHTDYRVVQTKTSATAEKQRVSE